MDFTDKQGSYIFFRIIENRVLIRTSYLKGTLELNPSFFLPVQHMYLVYLIRRYQNLVDLGGIPEENQRQVLIHGLIEN